MIQDIQQIKQFCCASCIKVCESCVESHLLFNTWVSYTARSKMSSCCYISIAVQHEQICVLFCLFNYVICAVISETNCHFHMSSFVEERGLNYIKNKPKEFVKYNMRQLSRIYPQGARINSSNYMPMVHVLLLREEAYSCIKYERDGEL